MMRSVSWSLRSVTGVAGLAGPRPAIGLVALVLISRTAAAEKGPLRFAPHPKLANAPFLDRVSPWSR
jgi:hypothetical protein